MITTKNCNNEIRKLPKLVQIKISSLYLLHQFLFVVGGSSGLFSVIYNKFLHLFVNFLIFVPFLIDYLNHVCLNYIFVFRVVLVSKSLKTGAFLLGYNRHNESYIKFIYDGMSWEDWEINARGSK